MTNYRVKKYFDDYENNVELKNDIVKVIGNRILNFGCACDIEDIIDNIFFSPKKDDDGVNEVYVNFCDDVRLNTKLVGILDDYFEVDGLLYCTGNGVSILYRII